MGAIFGTIFVKNIPQLSKNDSDDDQVGWSN